MQEETTISSLYQNLLNCWNQRSAADYAALLTEDASIIGFDGSQMNGRSEVESTLSAIFADHPTASYVGIVREVRFLSAEVALLRAVCGMIPRGQSDINPATNAIQSMVATKAQDTWQVALFQNTPAQFHGRPELSEALTEELRQLL